MNRRTFFGTLFAAPVAAAVALKAKPAPVVNVDLAVPGGDKTAAYPAFRTPMVKARFADEQWIAYNAGEPIAAGSLVELRPNGTVGLVGRKIHFRDYRNDPAWD